MTLILGFGFLGQSLIVSADPPTPTTPPASTKKDSGFNGPAIGGLKNCQVDRNRPEISATEGNKIIQQCIKDVISIVITIAVLISIASLVGYGIQLMNPMMESGKVNGQIVDRIKSLVVGGIILGMFGTILATINPATLTTSQILSTDAVANFKKYINVGEAATKEGVKTGTGTSTGNSDPVLKGILKTDGTVDPTKITATNKPQLQTIVDKNDQCTNVFADSSCDSYAPLSQTVIANLDKAGISSKYKEPAEITGPIAVKYDTKITKDATSGVYTATFTFDGKVQKATFKLRGTGTTPCNDESLDLNNTSTAGKNVIPKGCTLIN